MTENPEIPGEEPRKASSAPGLEGEGGQYVDGDYGDAGVVGEPAGNLEDGEYPDGDYGEAGASGTARQADAVPEERDPLHGRRESER